MKFFNRSFAVAALLVGVHFTAGAQAQSTDTLRISGLQQPVEIVHDPWGISHIYAANEHDLFFAQGYSAAHDRLFQLEVWRREVTGTTAELLGPRELDRDIGNRLFMFRGDMATELAHYHPHGAAIVGAFVDGINAYITRTERNPGLLPIEFKLLGTKPGKWTPAIVISRHQGLLGNIGQELNYGRAVAAIGATKVKELSSFGPGDPDLQLDPAIDGKLLSAPILHLYEAFRTPLRFEPADLAVAYRNDQSAYERLASAADSIAVEMKSTEQRDIGSNNWAVSGRLTQDGHAMMANDPHRAQSVPSLRYWVGLDAPGWHVVGGGEPEIPGISIGHNEYGAWGLTVFATDGEDLYVYQTNPANPLQYRYKGQWETMRVITDTIPVKGRSPAIVKLAYTRHGPVVYQDSPHHVAYAVRAAWLEPGGAPYLASLRMDQSKTWDEFRDASSFSNIPGENMVWADTSGNIGWQAVGIAPIRKNWSGLVPVPGDGRYEWDGFLPIKEKPHSFNPPSGFIATANNDLIPPGYPYMDAMGYEWADPYRWARISEVLGSGRKVTMMDMMRLQTDETSLPARELVPFLAELPSSNGVVERARHTLLSWNDVLDKNSVAAGIYEAWLKRVSENTEALMVPENARPFYRHVSLSRLIQWLRSPGSEFGPVPTAGRDSLMARSLTQAIDDLTTRFGSDSTAWVYGQPKYHYALIMHPMTAAVTPELQKKFDVGPIARGGDGNTVNATGGSGNQLSGPSFRIIADAGDWETALGVNNPGQSGNPDDRHYRDLFSLWANGQYFPVAYARSRVEAIAESRDMLLPASTSARVGSAGHTSHATPRVATEKRP